MKDSRIYAEYRRYIDAGDVLKASRVLKDNEGDLARREYLDSHVELYHLCMDMRVGNGQVTSLEKVFRIIRESR